MPRSTPARGKALAAAAFAIIGVSVIAFLLLRGSVGGDLPGAAPSPSPTQGETPSSGPSAAPTDGLANDPFFVVLDVATDHDVSVSIDDQTDSVVTAASGRVGDRMSVRWLDAVVENVGPATISVTWVGLPRDEELALTITRDGSRIALDFDQAAPPANSDAIGFDRTLVIMFDAPVQAGDVHATFTAPVPAS
jgi:hypothetical protein